jgi:hypothetical protein
MKLNIHLHLVLFLGVFSNHLGKTSSTGLVMSLDGTALLATDLCL